MVKKTGSPTLLFESLDLTPIRPILWRDLHRKDPCRPVTYDPVRDLRALMFRQLLQIPYVKDLAKRLRRNPSLRKIYGYGDRAPTEAHFTQMRKHIGAEGFRIIEAWLHREALELQESQPLAAAGLVQAACFDGTNLPAWSSRDPHDIRRGLGDPEARVGRGKKGFYLGYRLLFLTDVEGFPLGHVEDPVNFNEKAMVESLLDKVLGEDIEVELLAADSQLEPQAVFDAIQSMKMGHLIAMGRRGWVNPPDDLTVKDRIGVEGPWWKCVAYKRLRAAAEDFMGRAKSRLAYGGSNGRA